MRRVGAHGSGWVTVPDPEELDEALPVPELEDEAEAVPDPVPLPECVPVPEPEFD
jgi:hypothetical protein